MTRIAVLNAGSATLKAALFGVDGDGVREQHRAEHAWPEGSDAAALPADAITQLKPPPDAIGHRVVHGGSRFCAPARIDASVEAEIEALTPLAPLHNARALAGIRAARHVFPDVPAYAVFDTAFHADRPDESMCYALPAALVDELRVARYGFHGTAHAALARALADAQQRDPSDVTAVTLQLGAGCSACAIANGRSIETSMGYTPLEGLVMMSRSGDIDPSIVLACLRSGRGSDEIERMLNRESGLTALAGHGDMREILAAEARGDRRADLALRVFVRKIVQTVGAYLTLLNGDGALVFGGGIGTHAAPVRERIGAGLAAWDVAIDPALNRSGASGRISRPDTRPVFVFTTDEERFIAHEIAELVQQ
jgi:acetate kinase